jgi:hypothetical protein
MLEAIKRTLNINSKGSVKPVVLNKDPEVAKEIGFTGELRKGMWVATSEGKVGIATGLLGKFVVVDLVDETGATVITATLQGATLSQARWSQIPESRRPSQAAALSKGYFN